MDQLITIQQQDGHSVVSARDLHQSLGIKSRFADWIKNRIKRYGFAKEQDYTAVSKILENGGREIDYALTLDMAKELAMVEGNEPGKRLRQYFIAAEKQLRQLAQPTALPETVSVIPAEMMLQQSQLLLTQAQQITEQSQKLAQLEADVKLIMAGQKPPRPAMPREQTSRQQINELINAYCHRHGIAQPEAWGWLYDRLFTLYRVTIKAYGRKPGDSLLEVAERFGHLDKLYGIIMSELFYDDYNA